MDAEEVLEYLAALAWLGLFVYLPVVNIRRAGSLGAWLRNCARDPVESAAGALIGAGCCAFLLWILTDGWVSVKFALAAPAGFALLLLSRRRGRSRNK